MMTPKECAKAWKKVVECHNAARDAGKGPGVAMAAILSEIGRENAYEVFAVVAKIKEHDGRIYGKNREAMQNCSYNPECVRRERGNPVIYAGLDEIHPAHINQLITELLRIEN